jgi:hypothetical protein
MTNDLDSASLGAGNEPQMKQIAQSVSSAVENPPA